MEGFFDQQAELQLLDLTKIGAKGSIHMLREDALHPFVSGNKLRKLKHWYQQAVLENKSTFISFGGAYSNHLLALAALGQKANLITVGYVRQLPENSATIKLCIQLGMEVIELGYRDYRKRHDVEFQQELLHKHSNAILIPEGGAGELGEQGLSEMVDDRLKEMALVCHAVGTGSSLRGLANGLGKQNLKGYSAVPEKFLSSDFKDDFKSRLSFDFLFGGYAKQDPELVNFIKLWWDAYGILLDPIYTGKMCFGVVQDLKKGLIPAEGVCVIHSGGLQGLLGVPELYGWTYAHLPQALVSNTPQ